MDNRITLRFVVSDKLDPDESFESKIGSKEGTITYLCGESIFERYKKEYGSKKFSIFKVEFKGKEENGQQEIIRS